MSTKYFILSKSSDADTPNTTNDQIVYLGPRLHYILPQVNLEYYSRRGLFESALIQWCKQFCRPDRVFLDIGAHTGTYALSLAPHCQQVHAFEPQRSTFYALCGSIALSNLTNNIIAHNVGLGSDSQVGTKTLHIVSNDGGGSSIWEQSGLPILREEEIEIQTLDSMNLSNVGFIKMDVEDNELDVLRGAQQTFRVCGYPSFLFESNRENRPLFDYIENTMNYQIIPISGCANMFLSTKR